MYRAAAILTFGMILAAWIMRPIDLCPLNFPTNVTYLAPAAPNGKRIYLFPGLDVNVSADFGSGPLKEMVDRLRGNGAEIVLLPLPAPKACMFANGGARYRGLFAESIRVMTTQMDVAHGSRKSIVGGVSYGGLHAMMAAVTSDRFGGWFAMLPVTRLDALVEFPGVDAPRFDPMLEAATLRRLPGFLTWGTADDRVNWHLTAQLTGKMLSSNIHAIEYPRQPHETRAQNVDDVVNWIASQ